MKSPSVNSADSHVIRYRADIDGLRAVAVLSVVFYHLWKPLVPNGYFGVDIFFVISGYLISSIILAEIEVGAFRISKFYDRRIRRIMPALLVLLVATTIAAGLVLLPIDLVGYAHSVAATLGFVANIYFWRDTDYFAQIAETKPLLHMWSLGVEEQFYILFPMFLALLVRLGRPAVILGVVAVVVISLAADIQLRAAGGATPAFFLLPTRSWELGLGALVAVLPPALGARGWTAYIASAIGLLSICMGLFAPAVVGSGVPAALAVTLGTILLIICGRFQTPPPNWLLGQPLPVFLGLISYSLYLWHWPIIVLGRYYLVRDFRPLEALLVLVVAIAAATASWRYVERPFRKRSISTTNVRWTAGLGALGMGTLAAMLILSDGLPQRLNASAAVIDAAVGTNYRCPVYDMLPFGASRACMMHLPSRDPRDADVVLLGNSHAQMYAPLWKSILQERGRTGLLVPLNACLPTIAANISDCGNAASVNLSAVLALPHVKTVVLGLTWNYGDSDLVGRNGKLLNNRDDKALATALDDLIARLERAGKQVVLIGPIAEPGYDIASDLSRTLAFHRPLPGPLYVPEDQFRHEFGWIIDHFAKRTDIKFVRVDQIQCDNGRCDYLIHGHSLFSDSNHVAAGALPLFRPFFERAL